MTARRHPLLALLLALALSGCAAPGRGEWWQARRDPSGQAPDPATTREAVLQVYAARAVGWRGLLAVHTWIALKPANAAGYTRYEVMGWGVQHGAPAIRVNRTGPDNYWFGARPELILDRRGPEVEALIDRVEAAVATYPYRSQYRLWPGPNSNTFTAYIARAVPELGLRLPPTAIGKDYLPDGDLLARTPGGRGLQVSVLGLLGLAADWDQGLEVNLMGLAFGVDPAGPAITLPAIGRLGLP